MRVLATLFVVLSAALPFAGGAEVQSKVGGLAVQIAQVLSEEGHSQIAFEEITGPKLLSTAAGPMIQKALEEELLKRKIKVDDSAAVIVEGSYFLVEDDAKDPLTVQLSLRLRNKKGKNMGTFSAEVGVKANNDIVKLLSMNADLEGHTAAEKKGVNEKLREDLTKPPLHLDKTKIRVSKASPFSVEVFKRPEGGNALTPLTPEEKKGLAFVSVGRGEEYVLRVTNESSLEAAVSVTIDGVDAFTFFDTKGTRPANFLVASGKSREINGWPRNTEKVSAFLVGAFADSPAAKVLKSSAKVGTVTVCFHHAWEVGKTPEEYRMARSAAEDATTLGRDIGVKSRVVGRTIGPLLSAVTVRYGK